MITVHHLEKSRSLRVLWALEELGLEYEIVRYDRDPATMLAPASLRKVHPLGKSPVIVDGGLTLAESGAILEYLVDRYGNGRFRPEASTPERVRYLYWMHYAEGSLMPPLFLKFLFSRIPSRVPLPIRFVAKSISAKVLKTYVMPKAKENLDFLEAELAKGPWFAGEMFTVADIQMSYPLEAAAVRIGLEGRPRLAAWLERAHEREAFRRALEKNGPAVIPG
ncbi:glutathione S-transferase [Betaproteobacteria bacterium GR16-43]|nr:glutathione S-transferase [Betaproteobacteria bacterium GR16-43]